MKSGEVRRCAICGKPQAPESRPFCSTRCANVDLQRWFSGAYAAPVEEGEASPRDEQDDPDV